MINSYRYFLVLAIMGAINFLSCKKEYSCEECNSPLSPIAEAGPHQMIVLPKDSVLLDGSASTDPDGSIKSFQWKKIVGPAALVRNPDSNKTAVRSLVLGLYQFQLTVTDNAGLSAADTVNITVTASTPNQPPVAIAFWDSLNNLPTGSKIVTAKYSTDPDGIIVSYEWKKISGPVPCTILDPRSFETIISNLVQGTYSFELMVTDNRGLTAKDTVLVRVDAPLVNSGIHADAGPDQTITLPLDSTYLDGSGSSPNGFTALPNIIFRWTTIAGPIQNVLHQPPHVVPSLARTAVIANRLVPGVYLFTFTVTEPGVGSVIDTVQVTVLDDPQNRNTLTYHSLVWKQPDPSMGNWLTTFLSTPLRPDLWNPAGLHRRNLEFSHRSNAQSPWLTVPFRNNVTAAYVWYGLPYTGIILTQPDNPSLVGTTADMRIKIL